MLDLAEDVLVATDITKDILNEDKVAKSTTDDFDFLNMFDQPQKQAPTYNNNNFGSTGGNDFFANMTPVTEQPKRVGPPQGSANTLDFGGLDFGGPRQSAAHDLPGPPPKSTGGSNELFSGMNIATKKLNPPASSTFQAPKAAGPSPMNLGGGVNNGGFGGGGGWGDLDIQLPMGGTLNTQQPPTQQQFNISKDLLMSGLPQTNPKKGVEGLGGVTFHQGGVAKGNMAKLNFDPFAELDMATGVGSGNNTGMSGGGLGGANSPGWNVDANDLNMFSKGPSGPVPTNTITFGSSGMNQPAGGTNMFAGTTFKGPGTNTNTFNVNDSSSMMFSNPTVNRKGNQQGGNNNNSLI